MKIIIIGAGAVGIHLAKTLSWEGHDVVMIEHRQDLSDKISGSMDVLAIRGSGTSATDLMKAGVQNADSVIAVTSVDEVNILACNLARQLGVPTRIARVRNFEYSNPNIPVTLEELGINQVIHPEFEAAKEVVKLIKYQHAIDIVECVDGKLILVGLKLEADAPILNSSLKEFTIANQDVSFRVVAAVRRGETVIPTGETIVKERDIVYIITHFNNSEWVFRIAGKPKEISRDVMILGGEMIGRMVAEELEQDKRFNITLIEQDEATSLIAARKLVNTTVVRSGDTIDIDLLSLEGLNEMGVFAALTKDDESNIVTSLFARHLKVPRTITLISRPEYMPITRAIGLDAAINSRLIISDAILKYLHGGKILAVNSLRGIDAEIFEFFVNKGSKVADKILKDIKFPAGAIVGAISKENKVEVAVGSTVISTGSKVVMICHADVLPKIEKLFN